MSEFKLVYTEGNKKYEFIVTKDTINIGRLESNDLVLNDFGISRNHAALIRRREKFYIQDKGSRNGTLVNNVKVKEAEIHTGDMISLGRFSISFEGSATSKGAVLIEDDRDLNAPVDHTIIKPLKASLITDSASLIAEVKKPKGKEKEKATVQTKQREIMFILMQVAKNLISLDSLDEILDSFMDMVFEHLPVDRGFLMLGGSEGKLEPKLIKHRRDKKNTDQITISKTIAYKVFKDRVSILTTDAMMDPRFSSGDSIRFHGIRSAMCVPLWIEGEVIGILFVDSPLASIKFDEDDLNLLSSLANYAAVAIQRAKLGEAVQREAEARSKLERYHSPSVINQLLQAKGSEAGMNIEAQELECSVMFADIAGFTTFGEKSDPKQVAMLLNAYFSEMTEVIFHYDGTLDKFLGDGLMAVFGAPFPQEDHAERAVNAALEMQSQVQKLNSDASLSFDLKTRIGVNSGKVVAGDIGSPKRIEYTVLGDTVNVASRLEEYVAQEGEIVIGENTYKQIKDKFKAKLIGEIDIKGRSEKMKTYRILAKK